MCFAKVSSSVSKYIIRNPKCAILLFLLSIVLTGLLFYTCWNFVPSGQTLKTFSPFYYNLYWNLVIFVLFAGLFNLAALSLCIVALVDEIYKNSKRASEQTSTSVNLKFYENEDSDKLSIDAENVYIHSWIDLECYDPPIPLPRNLKKVLIQDERLLKNFLDVATTSVQWYWDTDQWGDVNECLLSPFELYIVHHQRIESVLDIIRQHPIWKLDVVKTYPNFMFCKIRVVVQDEDELRTIIRDNFP